MLFLSTNRFSANEPCSELNRFLGFLVAKCSSLTGVHSAYSFILRMMISVSLCESEMLSLYQAMSWMHKQDMVTVI